MPNLLSQIAYFLELFSLRRKFKRIINSACLWAEEATVCDDASRMTVPNVLAGRGWARSRIGAGPLFLSRLGPT